MATSGFSMSLPVVIVQGHMPPIIGKGSYGFIINQVEEIANFEKYP